VEVVKDIKWFFCIYCFKKRWS